MTTNSHKPPCEVDKSIPRESAVAIAFRGCVVKRALVLSAIVGTILVAINHGNCIVLGHFGFTCAVQSALTFLVPYCVSTVSSVLAYLEQYRS